MARLRSQRPEGYHSVWIRLGQPPRSQWRQSQRHRRRFQPSLPPAPPPTPPSSPPFRNPADTPKQAPAHPRPFKPPDGPWCLTVGYVNPHDREFFPAGTEFLTYTNPFANYNQNHPNAPLKQFL